MEFNIKINDKNLSVVLNCVAQQPYVAVAKIIDDIQEQVKEQAKEKVENDKNNEE